MYPEEPMPRGLALLLPVAIVLIGAIALLSEDWDAVRAYKNCLRSGNTDAACITYLHQHR